MGIARQLINIKGIIIVIILAIAIGLCSWAMISVGGQQVQRFLDTLVEKYDSIFPEITIRNGQASIREQQPYFVDTGDPDVTIVIDTREGKQAEALNYLKNVNTGAVLSRDVITTKNRGEIRIIQLKDLPDMVLNSSTMRDMTQEYFPWVMKVGIILVILYFIIVKSFQAIIFALVPYFIVRSKLPLTYGEALKISVIGMMPSILLDLLTELCWIQDSLAILDLFWFVFCFVDFSRKGSYSRSISNSALSVGIHNSLGAIMEFFLCVVGMVLIVEGIPYFGFPEKMKEFMKFLQEQDDSLLRLVGGSMMALGLLILLIARRGLGSM